MESAEAQFRQVEATLDDLIENATSSLRAVSVEVEEHSARNYHYKNDHLFWSYSFRRDWLVDGETARVTVRLFYGEPVQLNEAPELEFTWQAELFRRGQESRVEQRFARTCSLRELEREGISNVVLNAVAEASQYLPR